MFDFQFSILKYAIILSTGFVAACSSTDNVFVDSDRRVYQAVYADVADVLVATCDSAMFDRALPEADIAAKDIVRREDPLTDAVTYRKNTLRATFVRLPYSKKPKECFFRFDGVSGLSHLPNRNAVFDPMKNALKAIGFVSDGQSNLFTRGDQQFILDGKLITNTRRSVIRNNLNFTLTKV